MGLTTLSWPEISVGGGVFTYYKAVNGIETRIRMMTSVNGCAPMHIQIRGCALPRAKAPANAAEAIAAPRTNAKVDWILTSDDLWDMEQVVYTPSLSPIINEIMRIPGWARGCPMLFFFTNKANTAVLQEIDGYDEFIVKPDPTHAWMREVYWRDAHDSVLVLE